MASGGFWEVVGGADRGGIVVRRDSDTASEAFPRRLATGALVRAEAVEGERLRYELLSGEGPRSGWVSLRIPGKELLAPTARVWRVVGGGEKGGIFVRRGQDTSSEPCSERLCTGALLREVALEGERLNYELLSGTGPASGWVSVRITDKELVVRAGQTPKVDGAGAPTPAAPARALGAPGRIRVLAMAGSITCKEILKFQCGPLALALGRDAAEWTYAEGTHQHPWELAATLSDFERQVAGKRKQLTAWYDDIYHCDKDRPTIEKQFDPEVRVESVDIPEKVASLRRYLEAEGPFDVIVAFSQGCIMHHYLVGFLRKESEVMPWKLSVFFEGMHIRDEAYFDLFATQSSHPTVHVFGTASDYYAYAREGWCGSKRVEDYYQNPVVLTHDEGHQFPMQQPRAKEIYDSVAAEIRRHCAPQP